MPVAWPDPYLMSQAGCLFDELADMGISASSIVLFIFSVGVGYAQILLPPPISIYKPAVP